ncbi:hypothetical protein [Fimbriimonas ginsengisoli]|uniref:Uncharacterized protein n=1 Tax=Fimbriimonas ginsengisoli Gsoil 348 TaxID=661478 RepID=A0A068NSN9_FIMGI|nr:hypothetical protein [Fimbriimonas ginsengisoli]AIE84614.1 hypothetical protein OP10G_1246 [Fimbriimonas ginsengisoli Gsoil 348]
MLRIPLRRADGKELPYELEIKTTGLNQWLEFRVRASDTGEVLSSDTFHHGRIPLTRYHPDVEGGSMILGYEPDGELIIVEYGRDRRLALAKVGEVRSAVNVCRWHDRNLIAA